MIFPSPWPDIAWPQVSVCESILGTARQLGHKPAIIEGETGAHTHLPAACPAGRACGCGTRRRRPPTRSAPRTCIAQRHRIRSRLVWNVVGRRVGSAGSSALPSRRDGIPDSRAAPASVSLQARGPRRPTLFQRNNRQAAC